MAIISTILVATVIAGSRLVVSRRKYEPDMPLASSNSAVISAACHPLEGDVNTQLLPVQWDVVDHGVGRVWQRWLVIALFESAGRGTNIWMIICLKVYVAVFTVRLHFNQHNIDY